MEEGYQSMFQGYPCRHSNTAGFSLSLWNRTGTGDSIEKQGCNRKPHKPMKQARLDATYDDLCGIVMATHYGPPNLIPIAGLPVNPSGNKKNRGKPPF